MTPLRRARGRRTPALAATIATGLAAGATAVAALLPAAAGAVGEPQLREGQGTYDQRAAAAAVGATSPAPNAAARALARQLGPEGIVELDPVTDTPRRVLRTDGALTGPSADAPAEIALRYVREHEDVFRLDDAALAALGTPADVVSPAGIHRLRWTQRHDGVPVLGAELRAHVAADGRLLAVLGGPLPDPAVASTAPRLSASGALVRARRDGGLTGAAPAVSQSSGGPTRRTTFSDDSTAQLVVYPGAGGNRLAWSVRARVDSTHVYSYALDASSGAVLARHNMVRYASASGRAWEYVPSPAIARNGGYNQVPRTFGNDWISDGSGGSQLSGENAFAYSDVDDANPLEPAAGDHVPSTSGDGTPGAPFVWNYPFTPAGGLLCDANYPCSWAFGTPYSWRANREQNAVQAFWFVNTFHDHLLQDPIGFDEASGNFELNNAPRVGAGNDPVVAETDDGANTASGLPDGDHRNNANMLTPPDGSPPIMQMYLFGGGSFTDSNGGDDASVVYHEYGHGLSNRLVTDNLGEGALWYPQSGAMGEAWSDWYALDYLEAQGLQADDPAVAGEIVLGGYLSRSQNLLREASLDCPVGSAAPNCAGGGFTFGDYGRVWSGGPEVHADGEIWAQTLWDLRAALIAEHGRPIGVRLARQLVTEGMRDLPAQPSFLDARDFILAEAATALSRSDHDLVWEVFARRGMGWSASTVDAYDPAPFEAFDLPPSGPATASLRGTVTDAQTGEPLPGATVKLPGQGGATTTTGTDGRYLLSAIVATSYPRVLVTRNGFDDAAPTAVDVAPSGTVHDAALRRNFALSSGGTTVADVTAPVYELPCAPQDAIDGTFAHGWASYVQGFDGRGANDPYGVFPDAPTGPRSLVLRLPQAVDLDTVAIDPGAVCGDDDSASLGEYRVETRDGGAWREALSGRFGRDRNHRMNALTPTAGTTQGVTDVRVTMLRPQGGAGSSGDRFMDMAELAIYGRAVRAVGPPDPPAPPDPGQPAPPRQPDPTPPAGPAPPAPPAPPVARDIRGPALAGVRLAPARRALRALTGRGLKLTLRCTDEPCRVSATVTLTAATARRLGLTRRRSRTPFTLARASSGRLVAANRPITLTLRVSRTVARRLAQTPRLTPAIAIVATDAAGNPTPRRLAPRLRR